ncbi:MAG: SAM-dependent methyltransferase [Leptospirales bacterium]|jgi:23S rRNA (cytidine2498-2'-O)-methyltransferase
MDDELRHIFLCDAELASALADELRAVQGDADIAGGADRRALILEDRHLRRTEEAITLAFARQTLPNARLLPAASINEIARTASQSIIEACEDVASWRLDILRAEGEAAPGANRVRLVRSEIEAQLKKRRRRLLKTLAAEAAPADVPPLGAAITAPEILVQLYLETRERNWLSLYGPFRNFDDSFWRRCVSPWPGGMWEAAENRAPPSRAYRKLAEALTQFPSLKRPGPISGDPATTGRASRESGQLTIQRGELCVDLGASPGGWSWLALKRGAHVVAVDRSPLREDLMRHPGLEFVQGDAFQYRPERTVDWLICDVIAFPGRTLELLADWIGGRRCRKFCVTVKFRGAEDYGVLAELKNMLNKAAGDFAIRRLGENKNEVTVFGFVQARNSANRFGLE